MGKHRKRIKKLKGILYFKYGDMSVIRITREWSGPIPIPRSFYRNGPDVIIAAYGGGGGGGSGTKQSPNPSGSYAYGGGGGGGGQGEFTYMDASLRDIDDGRYEFFPGKGGMGGTPSQRSMGNDGLNGGTSSVYDKDRLRVVMQARGGGRGMGGELDAGPLSSNLVSHGGNGGYGYESTGEGQGGSAGGGGGSGGGADPYTTPLPLYSYGGIGGTGYDQGSNGGPGNIITGIAGYGGAGGRNSKTTQGNSGIGSGGSGGGIDGGSGGYIIKQSPQLFQPFVPQIGGPAAGGGGGFSYYFDENSDFSNGGADGGDGHIDILSY